MLTLEDCIGLSELDEEEILAIAEHEHIPEMAAVEMGNYLCHTPEGERRIRRMIMDDISKAREQGPARLDDKGSQRDADHSCDDSCKQRKRSYLLSYLLVRPPKRRSRPAKSTIASTKQAGVKSGQLTSVK